MLFHGVYGFIFELTGRNKENPWWRWILVLFQFWFNFAGAAIGWLAGYAVYLRFSDPPQGGLGWFDVALALTGALGITGHLPMTLAGIAGTPAVLAEYMRRKLTP